jgi:hypothetical protein
MMISYRVRAQLLAACMCVGGCQTADDDSALAPRVASAGPGDTGDGDTAMPEDACPGTLCDGRCMDTDNDAANCGGCGIACGDGQACIDGSCVISCPFGQIACDGECRDLARALAGARSAKLAEFEYTGGPQQFVVPTCVSRITVELWGAQGGPSECGQEEKFDLPDTQDDGGLGGYVKAELDVTPGTKLHVFVGGKGRIEGGAGYNGGGPGGQWAGGGGGASDVRLGGKDLIDRVLVAGGGGGGQCGYPDHGAGGDGGGLVGEPGMVGQIEWSPGGGGTQEAGGSAGDPPAEPGSFGQGGGPGAAYHVAGGGGGWYGGGGAYAAGGGGGSSFIGAAEGATTDAGVRVGDGRARITW